MLLPPIGTGNDSISVLFYNKIEPMQIRLRDRLCIIFILVISSGVFKMFLEFSFSL